MITVIVISLNPHHWIYSYGKADSYNLYEQCTNKNIVDNKNSFEALISADDLGDDLPFTVSNIRLVISAGLAT